MFNFLQKARETFGNSIQPVIDDNEVTEKELHQIQYNSLCKSYNQLQDQVGDSINNYLEIKKGIDESIKNIDKKFEDESFTKGDIEKRKVLFNRIDNLKKSYREEVEQLRNKQGELNTYLKKNLRNITRILEQTGDFAYKQYDSLGKKRSEMPQIDKDNIDDFLIHFSGKSNKAKVKKVTKRIDQLLPTQCEFDEDKILSIMYDYQNGNLEDNTFLISKESRILDGHHRYCALLELEPDKEVTCYQVNLPMKELLRRAKLMKITRKEDVQGNEVRKTDKNQLINSYNTIKEAYNKGKIDDYTFRKAYINYQKKIEAIKEQHKDIPNYRLAKGDKTCGNCGAFKQWQGRKGYCEMFDSEVRSDYTCDDWVEEYVEKAYYKDNPKNRKLGRVGKWYGGRKEEEKKENFKEWFEGSKVLNENGSPKIVYHGTDESFVNFNKEKVGSKHEYSIGFYFTTNKEKAKQYTTKDNVISSYLKIENPLYIEVPENDNPTTYIDKNRGDIARKIMDSRRKGEPYDGVIAQKESGETDYLVFNPDQIKITKDNVEKGYYDTSEYEIDNEQDKEQTKKYADVILTSPAGNILLLKRNKHDELGPSEYALPGGTQEAGEESYETAARELQEETNLSVDELTFERTYDNGNGTSTYIYSAFIDKTDNIILDINEHEDYIWVSPNDIDQLKLFKDTGERVKEIKNIELVKKAFNEGKISLEVFQKAYNNYIQKAKRANVGEIRQRKDGSYKKVGKDKWVPVKDQLSTGKQEKKVETISEKDLFNNFDDYKDKFKEVEKVKKGIPALKDVDTKTLISAVGDTPTEENEINNVHIEHFGDKQNGVVQISVKSKDFYYTRFIGFANSKLENDFENDSIDISKTGEGVGTKIFANQVVNAKKMGFDSMFCRAADQSMGDYNGYYTWARLGYDFDRDIEKNRFRQLLDNSGNDVLKQCETLPQLMTLPEGQKFWKENGFAFKGRFNLQDDSESMKLFNKYYNDKFGLQKAIVNDIEKGRKARIGEIRSWKDGKYQKTAQGWKPIKENKQKVQELKEEPEQYSKYENIDPMDSFYNDYFDPDNLKYYYYKPDREVIRVEDVETGKISTIKKRNEEYNKLKDKFDEIARDQGYLSAYEKDIRNNPDYETLLIYDNEGNLIKDKVGEKSSVTLSEEIKNKELQGKVVTHNHPTFWRYEGYNDYFRKEMFEKGTPFSIADIITSHRTGVKEMRAVAGKYVYSIKSKDEENFPILDEENLNSLYSAMRNANQDIRNEFEFKINKGDMQPEEAEARHNHELMDRFLNEISKKFGYNYEYNVIKIKDLDYE